MLRRLQRSLVFPTRGRSMSSANNTMRTRRVLCVFDFDWSFINENSDTFVFDALAPHLVPYLRAKRRELEWTPLMHHMQQKLVEELNLKAADVLQAMERIPVHPEMHDLMACLADERFESIIISDANEHYIDHILRHHRLHDRFSAIYTNKSALGEDGVLSIAPFHTGDPHACPHCPPNLCKGKVMDDVLRGREIDRIVYVGDGAGDYCPATRLRSGDMLLARHGFRLAEMLGKEEVRARVAANVALWKDGAELLHAMRAFADAAGSERE